MSIGIEGKILNPDEDDIHEAPNNYQVLAAMSRIEMDIKLQINYLKDSIEAHAIGVNNVYKELQEMRKMYPSKVKELE